MTPISGVWFHSLCFWLSADVCLISTIRTAISPAVSNTHTHKQACSLLLSHIHRYAHGGNISPSWPWARSAIIGESLEKESRPVLKELIAVDMAVWQRTTSYLGTLPCHFGLNDSIILKTLHSFVVTVILFLIWSSNISLYFCKTPSMYLYRRFTAVSSWN